MTRPENANKAPALHHYPPTPFHDCLPLFLVPLPILLHHVPNLLPSRHPHPPPPPSPTPRSIGLYLWNSKQRAERLSRFQLMARFSAALKRFMELRGKPRRKRSLLAMQITERAANLSARRRLSRSQTVPSRSSRNKNRNTIPAGL